MNNQPIKTRHIEIAANDNTSTKPNYWNAFIAVDIIPAPPIKFTDSLHSKAKFHLDNRVFASKYMHINDIQYMYDIISWIDQCSDPFRKANLCQR